VGEVGQFVILLDTAKTDNSASTSIIPQASALISSSKASDLTKIEMVALTLSDSTSFDTSVFGTLA
jgi:hypothetical protein